MPPLLLTQAIPPHHFPGLPAATPALCSVQRPPSTAAREEPLYANNNPPSRSSHATQTETQTSHLGLHSLMTDDGNLIPLPLPP